MARLRTILAVCLAYLCLLTAAAKKPSNAILLSKVKTLTLRGGQKTTARRTSAVPQLKCVGGSGKGYYDVDVMRCTNQGAENDAEDIQWTCQASLPPEFKLGSTDVICEGYDSPEDPYVLKGSCGVEYRLVLTEVGEERYGKGWMGGSIGFGEGGAKTMGERVWTGMFWVIFIGRLIPSPMSSNIADVIGRHRAHNPLLCSHRRRWSSKRQHRQAQRLGWRRRRRRLRWRRRL